MKKLFIIITITALLTTALQAGWFDKEERERRIQLEEQLTVQRQTTDKWQIVAGALAVSTVVLLIVGTALGSKARHHAKEK
ncbi:MAG: hypothetical protein V4710_12335 [Verrucomicrobiota bacterium]